MHCGDRFNDYKIADTSKLAPPPTTPDSYFFFLASIALLSSSKDSPNSFTLVLSTGYSLLR